MDDGKRGIEAALADEMAAAETEPGCDVQQSMPMPADVSPEAVEKRDTGRPKGARNKRAEFWQCWIGRSCKHPTAFLDEQFRADTAAQGEKLLTTHSARQRIQEKAAVALLPSIKRKRPTAIEDVSDDQNRPAMIVGYLSASQATKVKKRLGMRLADSDEKPLQDQNVIDLVPQKSHEDKSHGEAKALENRDKSE